jgi:hypothetical protein
MVRLGLATGILLPITIPGGVWLFMTVVDDVWLLRLSSFAVIGGHFAFVFLFLKKLSNRFLVFLGVSGWALTAPVLGLFVEHILNG